MSYIFIFVLGLIIGSFLNVCIYRIPQEKSIIRPSSRCPSCGVPIKFYDNIPVISYLLLRGKCRSCDTRLSMRYPLVELINAIIYVLVLHRFGSEPSWVLMVYFIFVSSLVIIFFIDIDHQIIPDGITLPGIPLAIIFGATVMPDPFAPNSLLSWKASITGMIAGGGFYYLIGVVGKAVLKKEAMGGGDIKMMAMVGALLGWKSVILTTFIGSLLGSITGIFLILFKGSEWGSKIPFGPYLAIGAIVSLLWGQDILYAWLEYLHGG